MSNIDRRIHSCTKVLEQIEEAATNSMPRINLNEDKFVTERWKAERNRRTGLLVQLYCAADVANSVGNIGPT